jgi:hypothetical protein
MALSQAEVEKQLSEMTDKQRAALAAKRRKDLLAWSPDKPKKKRCAPCKPGTSRAPKKARAKKAKRGSKTTLFAIAELPESVVRAMREQGHGGVLDGRKISIR